MKNLKVLFVYPNCMMDNLIPISLSSLMGALKNAETNIEMDLFDTTFYRTEKVSDDELRVETLQIPAFDYSDMGIAVKEEDVFEDFRAKVLEFKPDIIMISLVEVTYELGMNLLKHIRDIRPYVMAGGIYAITATEEIISSDCIDAVCIGEGEDAVVDFCVKYASDSDFTGIFGMWFKQNGNIIRNEVKSLVDLDTMPYLDFSLYEKERFYKPMQGKIFRMVPLEFSRGCPYRCAYCVNHTLEKHFKPAGRWYRWKSMDRIFGEIHEYVTRYKVEFFYFVSETFLSMPQKKFEEFCERYSEYKIPFWFNTRPETITKEKLGMLEEINCFRMGIGLEHGNREFRKTMLNRTVSNEKIIEACSMVEGSKISYSINNIIGFPGETRELVFDTIMLNRSINPDSVGTFVFTPFKGTDLYDYSVEHGYIKPDISAGNLNSGSVLENNTLSQDEIKGLLRTFPLYVHFEEKDFPIIKEAEKFTDTGNEVFHNLAGIYINEHFKRS